MFSTDSRQLTESLVSIGTMESMTSLQAVRILHSPIGQIAIGATDKGISDIEILVPGKTRTEFSLSQIAQSHCETGAAQLLEYFEGTRRIFKLEFDLAGTEFQKSVWDVIANTEFGQDISYGSIARELGKPNASRAVGGAVGANPVPLVIGCHRVLGSGRSLTGYSGGQGLRTKLWLLEHERIEYR